MRGLRLRRQGDLKTTRCVLTNRLENSQRDTETLGMVVTVLADLRTMGMEEGDSSGARDAVEKSRARYAEVALSLPAARSTLCA